MRCTTPSSLRQLAAVSLTVLLPATASAQELIAPTARPVALRTEAMVSRPSSEAIATMSKDLRRLIEYQQMYALNFYHFTDTVALTGFEPSDGVSVELLWARDDALAARADHAMHPGYSCVIWTGRVLSRDSIPVTEVDRKSPPEGLPLCDGDGIGRDIAERDLAIGFMRATLWRLAYTQARHEMQHGSFADQLMALEGFAANEQTQVELLFTSPRGWVARTTHPSAPGRSCVVWGGEVKGRDRPATAQRNDKPRKAGEVVCDG